MLACTAGQGRPSHERGRIHALTAAERVVRTLAPLTFELHLGLARALQQIDATAAYIKPEPPAQYCSSIMQYGAQHGLPPLLADQLRYVGWAMLHFDWVEKNLRSGACTFDDVHQVGRVVVLERLLGGGVIQDDDTWEAWATFDGLRALRKRVRERIEQVKQRTSRLVSFTVHLTAQAFEDYLKAQRLASQKARSKLTRGQTLAAVLRDYVRRHDIMEKQEGPRRVEDTTDPRCRIVPVSVQRACEHAYGMKCWSPGCFEDVMLDWMHIDPKRDGGSQEITNVGPGCETHHVIHDSDKYQIYGYSSRNLPIWITDDGYLLHPDFPHRPLKLTKQEFEEWKARREELRRQRREADRAAARAAAEAVRREKVERVRKKGARKGGARDEDASERGASTGTASEDNASEDNASRDNASDGGASANHAGKGSASEKSASKGSTSERGAKQQGSPNEGGATRSGTYEKGAAGSGTKQQGNPSEGLASVTGIAEVGAKQKAAHQNAAQQNAAQKNVVAKSGAGKRLAEEGGAAEVAAPTSDPAQGNVAKNTTPEPDAAKAETTKPDAMKGDVTKDEATKAEGTKADATKRAPARRDVAGGGAGSKGAPETDAPGGSADCLREGLLWWEGRRCFLPGGWLTGPPAPRWREDPAGDRPPVVSRGGGPRRKGPGASRRTARAPP